MPFLVGVALVLPIVFGPHERSLILKTLSTPVLSYLGLVSYGIYLWHQAFLTWTHDLFGWGDFEGDFIVLVIVGSLGSVAAAAASHRLVEAPLTAMVKTKRWLFFMQQKMVLRRKRRCFGPILWVGFGPP